jgi:Uncharacterised nucleotidyltransferase
VPDGGSRAAGQTCQKAFASAETISNKVKLTVLSRRSHARRICDDFAIELVARGLRDPGEPFEPSTKVSGAAVAAVASHHRVLALLGALLRKAGTLNTWPRELVVQSQHAERAAAALEQIRQLELTRVLGALASRGLPVLVFKGAALAWTHYPAPHVRTRSDTDLLVAPEDREAVENTFASVGYARRVESFGEFVSHQSHYAIRDRFGVVHPFDIHWKISNRHALADSLTFEKLWQRRRPGPQIMRDAWTLGSCDALLVAAVHRAGHHPGSADLLWMYDVHLLASRLADADLEAAAALARSRGLGGILSETLAVCHHRFATPNAATLRGVLERSAESKKGRPGRQAGTLARTLVGDVQALPTWRQRLALVREHVLPPASYMREKYRVRTNLVLPALYGWRFIAGAPKWLRRPEPAAAPPH